jgi:uncharacterized membrane protein
MPRACGHRGRPRDRLREHRCPPLPRRSDVYRHFRQQLGQSILLGLELLVGGDIVRTVAGAPSLTSVAILASIVLIRTFLSFSLER